MRRVVVTGVGMVNALGLNKDISFERIVKGESGIKRIESFDVTDFSVQIAGEIMDFNPESVLDPREVKKAHRFIQLGLLAAREALQDSVKDSKESFLNENLEVFSDVGENFGISSAAGIGGLENIQSNSIACYTRGPRRVSPFFIPSALVNMLGGFVSIQHKLKGPNLSSVTACAAGTHAIIEAAKTIMLGCVEKMLVVGAESSICAVGVGGFAAMKALSSSHNDNPQKASRPFDKKRDGFVMGEGAGALVLEEYESAKARGATIYGELCGFGESSDANHITTPAPEGEGAYRAMKQALQMANIRPDYINAHGTSTHYNDLFETQALKKVFNGNVPPVSSTKGQLGHCLGAAGSIEAVISLMAMRSGILPPTINQEESDQECNLDYIPNTAREATINCVMSNSFGFGGTNGVVIFKKCK
ncbi:beta-ketoacyl-ACP synthase [Helicobacter didelphidarum]|uniref:3-oxoacyl-[acyl-carrier-protein] synthase 2 n=1 Tax=Helicobacter didelphidarum TaxID=2040648 RepID=A0A3D8INB5_9HELI|nr:beta-ketoacyl-ACP synthase II [Helicobacter didelphidarum]RDU66702.1 beta-ketoacyl-ACP synthase [Helicobacter didelphidarum]